MENTLKIAVIVPCYNQGCFLDECINSLLKQDYTNWECILVNDGSTDNTEDKALEWQKKDSRIKYIKKANGGLSSARNFGLKNITGDYIQFLDCDDFLSPEKFSKSVKAIENNNTPIVISNFVHYDNRSKKIVPAYCNLNASYFNFTSILMDWDKSFTIPIHCALFPKSEIQNILFNEELKAKEDWFFWLQTYKNNPATIFIDEPLAIYRLSSSSMTKNLAFMHENQMNAFQKIEQLINNKELYLSYLRYNNEFCMNEIFRLTNELHFVKQKRKLKYKINKILKFLKLK